MRERIYSIKDLEVMSGIKAHTIRIWEKRYNLLEPDRTDTNIRLYSDADLRKLLNVSFLVNRGYKISKVSTWNDEKISAEILKQQHENADITTYLERMTVYMVNFDGHSFTNITDEIIKRFGFDEAINKVFFPFFEKIGIFWQVGSIFPAQEHYISNLFRQKLIVEIDKLGTTPSDADIMLFYLHENEMHELSLLYYSYLARKKGYQVYYLGQNVPLEDLSRIGIIKSIKFVFTAFINSIETEELENYLVEINKLFDGRKILITGRQLDILKPKIPAGISTVKTYYDFQNLC